MYTLMKSERTKLDSSAIGFRAYEQEQVAQYADFYDAAAACDQANREHTDRHYLLNDAGKELYADAWID